MKSYSILSQAQKNNRMNIPKDKNLQFIKSLDKCYSQERSKNTPIVKENLRRIKQKLQILTYYQQQQWAEMLVVKCKTLHKKGNEKDLSLAIKTLVSIVNELKIEYNFKAIEDIIRQLYYQKYGNDIVPLFQKAGYQTTGYEILQYSQPWYSKLFETVVSIF